MPCRVEHTTKHRGRTFQLSLVNRLYEVLRRWLLLLFYYDSWISEFIFLCWSIAHQANYSHTRVTFLFRQEYEHCYTHVYAHAGDTAANTACNNTAACLWKNKYWQFLSVQLALPELYMCRTIKWQEMKFGAVETMPVFQQWMTALIEAGTFECVVVPHYQISYWN